MKCPDCRTPMIKVTIDHDNYWRCPKCQKEVGKKVENESKSS